MSRRLEGKVAIVTGAGTGIGAIAHKFTKEGANVVVNGLPDAPILDVAESIKQYGGQAVAYRRGTPEEMAVCPFLASDEASYVTGALWLADGGVTVAKGAVGEQTPQSLRKEPQGKLRLDHSREGLENKETQTVK